MLKNVLSNANSVKVQSIVKSVMKELLLLDRQGNKNANNVPHYALLVLLMLIFVIHAF